MKPTDAAVEKKADQGRVDGPESVFSAHCLPVDFYTDIYHGFEVKGIIDLSVGQGTAAKAALQLRLPYFGLALTDEHCLHIEKLLTESILENMAQESSTFYRPEMDAADLKKTEDEEKGGKPKPKPAPKKTTKKPKTKKEGEGQEGAGNTEEDETHKGKKRKKDEEDESVDSLPW